MVDRPATPRFIGIDRRLGPDNTIATATFDISGLLNPGATLEAMRAGMRERAAQDVKWGESNHPDIPKGVNHPCAYFGIPTAAAAQLLCETAFRVGSGSNAHILLEEVCEAIEAATDPVQLRAELVQVMAVAMKWVEQIDRRAGFGGQAGHVIGFDDLSSQEVRS